MNTASRESSPIVASRPRAASPGAARVDQLNKIELRLEQDRFDLEQDRVEDEQDRRYRRRVEHDGIGRARTRLSQDCLAALSRSCSTLCRHPSGTEARRCDRRLNMQVLH
jgi:hypothetical protein